MYEGAAKRELEEIHKLIIGFEDRFPSIVEDPATFEVAAEEKEKGKQKNKE
jgi:hypothetical protein